MVPDARKSLRELREEWESCTRCDLGTRRIQMSGSFVFGEGVRRSIMFIGEGPGENEEAYERPFVGKSGQLLRKILDALSLRQVYITNVVTCRSCEPVLDEAGLPRMRRRRGGPSIPMFRDQPPTPTQWKSCLPRLHEEIYLVDPTIIVSLGVSAAEALIGRPVTITRDRGREVTIRVPGAGVTASFTEKRHVWFRKVDGAMSAPVVQSEVEYPLIPTLHPAFVLRKIADKGHNSPFRQLVDDIKRAARIHDRYIAESLQQPLLETEDVPFETVFQNYLDNEEDNGEDQGGHL